MTAFYRFQNWTMVITVIFLITISSNLDFGDKFVIQVDSSSGVWQVDLSWIFGVIIAVAGAGMAELATNKAANNTSYRKWLNGGRSVEGHWYLRTFKNEDEGEKDSSLLQDGIAHIFYDHASKEFAVETTRLDHENNSYVTTSEAASIRTSGPKIRYLNFFRLRGPRFVGSDEYTSISGFSSGVFIRSHERSSHPVILEADISVEREPITRRQQGQRIPDGTCKLMFEVFGDQWLRNYLLRMKDFNHSQPEKNTDAMNLLLQHQKLSNNEKSRLREYLNEVDGDKI
ncbi:MAG: hypothetical protein AAF412_00645 [Pseudomonadota bacterium]